MIQSPIAWLGDRLNHARLSVGTEARDAYWPARAHPSATLEVRRIGVADLAVALARGLDDFAANRTDVIFLCLIYPLLGLLLARLASGYGVLPLVFPLASGFALLGPLAAIGLNEMSRRREMGLEVRWVDAFHVLRAPSIGAIAALSLLLVVMFLLWLVTAEAIYLVTLGPLPPASIAGFAHDVLLTPPGWLMIVLGISIGFLFALLVFTISVVSFPLLLDRDVGMEAAIWASFRAVSMNPWPMTVWAALIVAALVVGSVPFLLGLAVVMPILGHATWHLYRALVAH